MTTIPRDRPPAREAGPELLVLHKWEETTRWLLDHTNRWPKAARFTLTQRLQNHALDLVEVLVLARYEPAERRRVLRAEPALAPPGPVGPSLGRASRRSLPRAVGARTGRSKHGRTALAREPPANTNGPNSGFPDALLDPRTQTIRPTGHLERQASVSTFMEPSVHDRFARRAFADLDVMRAHLRGFLPAEILERINLSALRREPDTLLDPELRERIADLVFSAPIRDGGTALVRFVFEHKSRPERSVSYDLWCSSARLTERWRCEHPADDDFPWVIPVVLYAGPRPLIAPRRYAELCHAVGADDDRFAVGPDLSYVLNDLTRIDDDELRARCGRTAYEALVHLLLKHAWDDDLPNRLRDWADLLVGVHRLPTGLDALRSVLSYVWGLDKGVTQDDVARIVLPRLKLTERDVAMTTIKSYADQLRDEGLKQGLEQGLEQGRLADAREKLLRLIRSRFDVNDEVAHRMGDDASVDDLDRWFDRALVAESMDDVFATEL